MKQNTRVGIHTYQEVLLIWANKSSRSLDSFDVELFDRRRNVHALDLRRDIIQQVFQRDRYFMEMSSENYERSSYLHDGAEDLRLYDH